MTTLYEVSLGTNFDIEELAIFFAAPESHDNKVKKASADESPAPEVAVLLKDFTLQSAKDKLENKMGNIEPPKE
jgi:hypothetical protein